MCKNSNSRGITRTDSRDNPGTATTSRRDAIHRVSTNRKRPLWATLFLTAVMLLTLVPLTAHAATGVLTVGGQTISNTDIQNNQSGTGWQWTAATNTLTLGANGTYAGQKIVMNVSSSDVINLVYSGAVTVWDDNDDVEAIYCKGSLNISGSGGTLYFTSPNKDALRVIGDLNITSGTINAATGNSNSSGIYVSGNISIGGSADVTARNYSTGSNLYGIYTPSGLVTISTTGNITASGSYIGISANGISISSGAVTAKGGSYGLSGVTGNISGGTVTVGEWGYTTGNVIGNFNVSGSDTQVTVIGDISGYLAVSGGTVVYTGTLSGTTTHTGGTINGQSVTYTVSGTITGSDAPSGLPATLQLKQGSGNVGASVTAAANGNYTISSVPANTGYIIEVTHTGYTTGTIASFAVTSANVTGKDLVLQKTVAPVVPPTITTTMLVNGTVGTAYSQTLTATGGGIMTWSIESGNLPAGLTLNSTTGEILETPTAAGTANFTVKASNGVSPDATQALSIAIDKAALVIDGATLAAKTYDGSADATVSAVSFTGVSPVLGTDYTATAVFTGAAPSFAGTGKNAEVTVTLTEAGAAKYTLAQTTFDLTGQSIAKAPASEVTTADSRVYIAQNTSFSRTFDLRNILLATAQPVGTVSYTLGAFTANNYVVSTPMLNAEGYGLEYTDGTGTGTVGNYSKQNIIISTTNYENISIDVWFVVTDKTPVTISGVSVPAKIYDGTAIAPTGIGSETITGDTPTKPLRYYYNGSQSDGYYYTTDNIPPTKVGTYTLTIFTDPDDNVAGYVNIPFVIAKRPLTITAEDKSVTVGDPAPAYTYTANLATGDTESDVFATAPSLSCAYTSASAAGTYPITVSNAVLKASASGDKGYNYEIASYVSGTLTVSSTPTTYGVSIGTLSNGNVTASPNANITAGTTVTLTVTPDAGYELNTISAYETDNPANTLTPGGTGNSRTFTMPSYGVTVTATFKPFTDQTDILNAKAAIEGMTNVTVAQATANTEAAVKSWLVTQINSLAALSGKSITVSEDDITTGNDFTAAIEGNAGNHSGTPGSFSFTVSLQKGSSATVTTASKSGVITATIFIPTPSAGDLTFTIPPANVYNGSAQGIGAVTGATGMGTVTVYYTGTGYAKNTVAPVNAGTYDVTADIAAGTNYTAATGISLGSYTIGKATANGVPKEVTVPVNFTQNVNVTLAELLPALSGQMSFGTIAYSLGSVTNADGVLGSTTSISGSTLTLPVQSISDANRTATVSITVSSDNFNNFTATITVKTVATTALSVTGLAVKTKTYDGNTAATLEGTAALSGVQAGHNVSLSGTPSATFDNKNAGTSKAVTISGLSLTGADRGWYHLDLSGFTGEISQKALANGMIAAISGQTYNGTAQTPALTVTDGSLGALALNTDYENTTYSSNTNAGTASASITGKGNYTGTASVNFSIAQATITASSATLAAKTYDGTTAGTASGLTFTGLQNNEALSLGTDFTASAAYDNANAGTNRTATVTVTLSGTAKADNYQIAASGNAVSLSNQTIGKATTTGVNQTKGVEKNRAQNVSFDLTTLWTQPTSPKTLGTVTYNPVIAANANGVLGALSYNTGNILTLPVQSISEAGKTATVTVTVGSTNYADFTATITVKTEDTQDDADIATAKSHVEGANYATTQVNAPTQATAKTVVENIIGALNLNGVTATVNNGTFTAATAGTASSLNGTNGSYTFTVTLSKGYGTPQTIGTLTLAITATPYNAAQDNLDITAAKALVETAGYTDTQANIPDATAAKAKVEAIIAGLSLNGVTPTVNNGTFTAATAGTPSNMNGTNGSYTFTVKLNKGGGTEQTTVQLTLTVTATPYNATQDNADISAAKALVENAGYTDTQANIPDAAAAEAKVEAIIAGLSLNGVTPTVAGGTFSQAIAGTVGNLAGTNGSYKFTVNLNKGGGTQQTTVQLTLTVIATPYDATQDNLNITAAKALVEAASYTDTQVNVPNAAAAKTKVEAIIGGLALNGVTPAVVPGAFTSAIAGTATSQSGTNGSYKFTVNLNKGGGTEQTTVQLTLTVTATPYDATQDNVDISAAKTAIESAAYTDTQVNAPDAAAAKAAVEAVISRLNLNGVTPTVVPSSFTAAIAGNAGNPAGINGSYTFTVNLNKGGGTQQTTISLTLIVTATPYTPPLTHLVNIATTTYGTVSANPANPVAENAAVTLTISPATGYELNAISAHKTGDAATTVTLNGTSNTRTFTMPAYDVTVNATFKKTADQMAVETAQTLIEGMNNVAVAQTAVNTEADVKSWLVAQINALAGMSATGITVSASDITLSNFLAAVAGNAGNSSGTNGGFTFTVSLQKGNSATLTTASKNGTITATPYGTTQDNADISAAKLLIESATYTETQVNVPDATYAKAAVEAIISTLNLNGVTATVVPGSFTAAVAGNAGNPSGTNGSYTFTVNLNKGGGTQQTTVQLTLTVIATPYTPPSTHLVNISTATNGTVSANPVNPVAESATVTLTVNPATGYELDAISAHKTGDASVTVPLNGFDALNALNGTFTMPTYDVTVNATFRKTADQSAVEAAQSIIEGMNNATVAQETANTEASVKSWLAAQINALAGMSATGITVSASDITLANFSAAVAGNAGNPSGTNGGFTFTVSLQKGSSQTLTTAGINGTITATDYIFPTYAVTIGATTNGTVTANPDANITEGTTVTLTITPNAGYELDAITAHKTGDVSVTVSLNGFNVLNALNGNFEMPAFDVTITATFKKTQAQLDKEAVEAAKASIEGGTYRIAQATGNDAASVKMWLASTLNILFGQSHGLQVKSAQPSIVGDVTITAITPATAGTESAPDGVNGSFTFSVSLARGSATATATFANGVIIATPHASTPVKRIEVLYLGNLKARILNTGNIATGDLTLALSGTNADVFTLSQATVNSLAAGNEADITLIPRANLAAGTYTATLTVSGDGIAETATVTYTVTTTGIDSPQANALKAYVQNGLLHVSGLTVGKTWSIYSISGALIYQSVAHDDKADFNLSIRGVYIVTSGNKTVKVIY